MHFVYCWEIGADLGHITQLATIAKALQSRGHTVSAVLKDTTHALRYLQPLGIAWFQAPHVVGFRPAEQPLNHADLLTELGYGHATRLAGLIQAWRSLLAVLQPDCVLAEAAPTSALAARTLSLRVVTLDNGFFCPPLSTPLPPLRHDYTSGDVPLLARENQIIEQVDQALNHIGLAPLERFNALFEHETYWLTWPEINHFGYHSPGRHLGPLHTVDERAAPPASHQQELTIFAYLKTNCPASVPALEWCIASGYRVIAYLPMWPQKLIARLEATGRLTASAHPLELDSILSSCAFSLCHSGIGTVTQSLLAGTPLLLLPTQAEQFRTATALVKQGLALMPYVEGESEVFGFNQRLFEPCVLKARCFADKKATVRGGMKRLIEALELGWLKGASGNQTAGEGR
jgi:UDP:flavonoid glycosyltransferase YjiC (YdhE family)